MPPQRIGTVKVLSCSTTPNLLPSVHGNGESTVLSFYLRSNVETLALSAERGIIGDCRAAPSHQTRQRDILFADPVLLREVGNIPGNKSLETGTMDKPCDIGQNVTLAEGDPSVTGWCVGDLIEIGTPGAAALVRVTSTRRPCPKNNNVHGEGTWPHMERHGLGGVFGTIVRDGTVRLGDPVVLVERLQSKWTCVQVHLALYGRAVPETTPMELREIAALDYLEEPRYKKVAKERLGQVEVAARRRHWEALALIALSVVAFQLVRRCSCTVR